jgi:hypothetical protein
MAKADWLTEKLLQDREIAKQREAERRAAYERQKADFNPFDFTRWRSIAGGDPGYLPKTPMRMGPVGWFIRCRACAVEFESKGWAYCPTCMDLPAEARRRDGIAAELPDSLEPIHSHESPSNGFSTSENAQKTQPLIGPQDWPVMVVGPRLPQHRPYPLGRVRVRPWV